MKTVLIIFLINLMNPSEPGAMVHKSFPTEAACQQKASELLAGMPKDPGVKASAYCTSLADLADSE